jgi:hypothetical protein
VQLLEIDENDLKFQVPASICVTGPSQSGKSEWILKLIKNRNKMFPIQFYEILYCVPEHLGMTPNPIFEKIKESFPTAQLVSGLPDVTKLNLNFDETPKLLIIDDLMTEFLASYAMVKLLSIEVHHYNITTVFTLHNLFAPSKFGRTICRNINYKVLFQNRLDLRECRNVSLQICNQPNFLSESFEFLNQEYPDEPSYIVIDGHIRSKHKKLFVRSQIFPDHDGKIEPIYFFPKNQS